MAARILSIATRSRPAAEMCESDRVEVTLDGLAGEKRRGRRRQVTLLAREAWELATAEVAADLPWTTRRANLLVSGLDLAGSLGRRIRAGSALLEVTDETAPCELMDRFHLGLREALAPDWRGGATARVLESGVICIGDPVSFEA